MCDDDIQYKWVSCESHVHHVSSGPGGVVGCGRRLRLQQTRAKCPTLPQLRHVTVRRLIARALLSTPLVVWGMHTLGRCLSVVAAALLGDSCGQLGWLCAQ